MTPLLLVCALLAADASPPQTLRDEFDEPVTRLVPATPRGEDAQLKVLADALYAHGRLLMQRREFPAALRRLQRAWRTSPRPSRSCPKSSAWRTSPPPGRGRPVCPAGHRADGRQPGLVAATGGPAVRRQEWPASLALFEASLQAGPRTAEPAGKPDEDLAALLVYLEIGRLALLTQDFAKSADYFGRVREALEQPERLAKNEAVKNALLGQADRTYRLMAEGFYQAGRYDDAEALYRRAYQQPTGKDNPGLLGFYLARLAAKRGQTDAALQHLDSYFATPSSAAGIEPYELLARLLGCTEPDQAAVNAPLQSRLEKLLEADSRNPALLSYLAGLDLRASDSSPPSSDTNNCWSCSRRRTSTRAARRPLRPTEPPGQVGGIVRNRRGQRAQRVGIGGAARPRREERGTERRGGCSRAGTTAGGSATPRRRGVAGRRGIGRGRPRTGSRRRPVR